MPCVGARLRAIRGCDVHPTLVISPASGLLPRRPGPGPCYTDAKGRAAAIRRDFLSGRGGDGDYFRAAQSSAMGTANICGPKDKAESPS